VNSSAKSGDFGYNALRSPTTDSHGRNCACRAFLVSNVSIELAASVDDFDYGE